jgi:hypothetical protein
LTFLFCLVFKELFFQKTGYQYNILSFHCQVIIYLNYRRQLFILTEVTANINYFFKTFFIVKFQRQELILTNMSIKINHFLKILLYRYSVSATRVNITMDLFLRQLYF